MPNPAPHRIARKERACPACGVLQVLHVNTVCGDCSRKLNEYPRLVAQIEQATANTAVYWVAERRDSVTQYHVGDSYNTRVLCSQPADILGAAFGALVGHLAQPVRGYAAYNNLRDHLIKEGGRGHSDRLIPLRFRPEVAAALDTLDQTIRAYATATYRAGVRDGASLLHELAAGRFTETTFDEAVTGGKTK